MMKIFTKIIAIAAFICAYPSYASDLFPGGNSSFYYRIGGGRDVPRAAVYNTETIPLGTDERIGLGYHCGAFDPKFTLTESLNRVKDSIHNMQQSVMSQATSAITSFPMYMLMRANPKLYNLLNNNILSAQDQFSINMKSCESMQEEALRGENPYSDWITVSGTNTWKEKMNKALSALKNSSAKDLNKAKREVDETLGDKGVPWISPADNGYAGGKGQVAIYVIRDTTIAGFNVLAGRGNKPSDTTSLTPNDKNARLTRYWKNPTDAAKWVSSVAGDQKITTCKGCSKEKNSSPGLGLLPSNQSIAEKISTTMTELVSGKSAITKENLNAVSAPGIVVSSTVIRTIQKMDPNQRALVIDKVSANIATAITADMALLAKRILQSGAQVPVIRAVKPAQREISEAIQKIDADIKDLISEVSIRRQLVADPLTEILNHDSENTRRSLSFPKSSDTIAPLDDGGNKEEKL